MKYEEGFDSILVVDGVPIIDESKRAKLLDKIAKEFGRKGAPIKPVDISVPWNDSNGKSKGLATGSMLHRTQRTDASARKALFSLISKTRTMLRSHRVRWMDTHSTPNTHFE